MESKHTPVNCVQREAIGRIETKLDFLQEDRNEIKTMLTDRLVGIHAENMAQYDLVMQKMQANHDIEMEQFKRITDRQDVANHRVTKLEKISDNRNVELEDIRSKARELIANQKFWKWVVNNPIKVAVIFFLIVWGMVILTAYIDLKTIIDLLK